MKLSKQKKKFLSAKKLTSLLALMLTLNGCAKPDVKIVIHDSFCEGKYNTLWLEKKDFKNIDQIRQSPKWAETINKYIDYQALNEKEFDQCPKEK